MATYPTRYRLPSAYNTNIGRVITRFAYLEAMLRKVVYILMESHPKLGRIAIRSPRVADTFAMIEDIMALRKFTTTLDLKETSKELRKVELFRDRLAHCIWVKHSQTHLPVLQITSGSYAVTQGGESVKAKINPNALLVTPQDFKAYLAGIDEGVRRIKQLGREIDRQRIALRKRSRTQ